MHVIAACPGGEAADALAVHGFVDTANRAGFDAAVLHSSTGTGCAGPALPEVPLVVDAPDTLFVVSGTDVGLLRRTSNTRRAVWWIDEPSVRRAPADVERPGWSHHFAAGLGIRRALARRGIDATPLEGPHRSTAEASFDDEVFSLLAQIRATLPKT